MTQGPSHHRIGFGVFHETFEFAPAHRDLRLDGYSTHEWILHPAWPWSITLAMVPRLQEAEP